MSFAVGSLVKARGREWVVLPGTDEEMLIVRPLGGIDEEVTGIHLNLENIEPAQFGLPDPTKVGDYRSARLLRDAVRLGFRNSAGPFRSFARLAVDPRPYQLVPLLMALKLEPVRLLIADDVGIGKTIEAGLIARELLDRGEIERLAVLCPPQLAEQWQDELRDKFHIEAELVLPSTVSRLERGTRLDQSLFDIYPYVIVSTDFIKSDRRRDEFIRTCPELVIVDEAHTCAFGGATGRGRHQRHELVSGLAAAPSRHLILVTATPHSGKEDAFRSLLGFLNPAFEALPEELSGPENRKNRRWLAQHFVQRRRVDIRNYLGADTHFPERVDAELTYTLSAEYKRLFNRVLEYAREMVKDETGGHFRQRVRWWSALALLRSMASSPAAAASTLRARAATLEAESVESADEIGRRTVFDLSDAESIEGLDIVPGSDTSELEEEGGQERAHRRLLDMAREADKLAGKPDAKLAQAIQIVKDLVRDGYRPILFCRFIPTAEYVAEHLRSALRGVEVMAVTGTLPPAEREARVQQLSEAKKHVLVATDCLSEGINLQDGFDAVVHYDLSWNPTRHEQREGRVDRFGQAKKEVSAVIYYGIDNQIDGVVLDVLLRKHRSIRKSLGISVPVPVNTDDIVEAIFEGLLLRERSGGVIENYLPGFEAFMKPKKEDLYGQWDSATERERRSRTMFAQEGIKVDEVSRELDAAREAVGLSVDVSGFVRQSLQAQKAVVNGEDPIKVDLVEVPRALKDLLGLEKDQFEATFTMPVKDRELYLTRTHPLVENLATYIMDTAMDGAENSIARRCGAIRTKQVEMRTTLLLLRLRYHLITIRRNEERTLLAEEVLPLVFTGSPDSAQWLDANIAEELLKAEPDANIHPQQVTQFVRRVIEEFDV
ncbi:MAG: DEAD/DEAH box helicase, partial [Chloroflexi bacterium]|nr:DEAD/DEAH box helicase [Chloroflexota bacterium]